MQRDWWEVLKELGGVTEGHTVFSSGRHGATLLNSAALYVQPELFSEACQDLCSKVHSVGLFKHLQHAERIVGPALGAVPLAYQLAACTAKRFGCTERTERQSPMRFERFSITPGEKVLVVEDVGTTFGTTRETAVAVEQSGGIVVPLILALVNRGDLCELDGLPIISLVKHKLPSWPPEACPVCNP